MMVETQTHNGEDGNTWIEGQKNKMGEQGVKT
jgi:hypothetical protein